MTVQSGSAASRIAADIVEVDVVVIGGGGSGLAAAIEAAELGRNVVLVEKNRKLGGSTAWSVGSVTATNTPHQLRKGIKDCPEHHFEDMGLFCAKLGMADNEALRRLLVDNASDTFRWLVESGVEFVGPLPEPPHRKPRMHNVLPNSRAFIYHLEKRARRSGVTIRTGVRAESFIAEAGKVTGVRCRDSSDRPVVFQAAGGVVLATGDFSGSAEMRARFISPAMENVRPINATNTGDGHRMVLDLGGRVIHPDFHLAGIRFQAPPAKWITRLPPYRWLTRAMNLAMTKLPDALLRPFVMSFLTTILLPSPHLYAEGAILINRNGERFADEMGNPAPLMAEQPDQLAYILLDGKLAEKFSRWPNYVSTAPGVAYAYLADYRRNRRDVFHEGETLVALAGRLGIAAERLKKTVEQYNASLDGAGANRPRLEGGPYVALGPVRYYINFSDSGVAVNDRLEVLGEGDQPLDGLYAAGFVGMGGILLEGHGHHLAWAFVSGRLAGRTAALRALTADLPRSEGHSYRSPAAAQAH